MSIIVRHDFYTDVICQSDHLKNPKRISSLDLLEPTMRELVLAVVADAAKQGLDLMVYETYRSRERQQELFSRKATKRKDVGVHHYGLGCDLVKNVDGDPSWKGNFDLLGKLARKHDLLWGGDWGDPDKKHGFIDPVHVQRCSIRKQASLFSGKWYPGADYSLLRDG